VDAEVIHLKAWQAMQNPDNLNPDPGPASNIADPGRRLHIIESTLSAISDFFYAFDREARFVYINKALLDLWGLTLDQAVGKNFFELKYPDDLAAKLTQQILHVFATRQSISDETPYTSETGAGGVYEYIFTPVPGADGAVDYVAGTTRDVTRQHNAFVELKQLTEERKELLESERAARADAERASRLKDDFLATLSHELRTPLGAILGWTHVLSSGKASSADVARGIEVIERNARMQAQLIDDLLDMSRIVSGSLRLNVQPVLPATFVEAAIETVMPAAAARDITIEKTLSVASTTMSGDADRLQQVVWNLLSNAIKFTPRGGRVCVSLSRVESTPSPYIEISVSDNGQGIAPNFLPHVFDRFRQADSSERRPQAGLGIGLAIVKQLVELHGGTVCVSSPGTGLGATFSVRLPLDASDAQVSAIETAPLQPVEQIVAKLENVNIAGVKILVIEDETDVRDVIQRILEASHAQVFVAASASEGLTMMLSEKPDVLVSDIGMPDVDGYEFLRRVHALTPAGSTPIPAIALTAFARTADKARALDAGYVAHVTKPAEPARLVAAIAAALLTKSANGPAPNP
jgi:PAS domain S-box-containing protein